MERFTDGVRGLGRAQPKFLTAEVARRFVRRTHGGGTHVEEMVEHAAAERGFRKDLARAYFTRLIVYPLGSETSGGVGDIPEAGGGDWISVGREFESSA